MGHGRSPPGLTPMPKDLMTQKMGPTLTNTSTTLTTTPPVSLTVTVPILLQKTQVASTTMIPPTTQVMTTT